ncbi:hypothetical protein CAPTEDRAFT_204996 [Capitella teleta]|uniref:Uncharacterized protein n=1 Tax=Capitella teleta TaxID=283909 RepID=R7UR11_CAPTE|nr:hypothetical protein CAPTEDRAFT_204996 [Capitella teleta]|eukprot:ELU06377.1 hypothetical protein CAPTEDRAFT_204996 [Capitella teleta]
MRTSQAVNERACMASRSALSFPANTEHSPNVTSRRLEAGRSPCNKAQQLSSFESEQEHGKRRCTPPVYFKDYDTDGSGSLPRELKVDMQVPSAHSAKKGKSNIRLTWREYLICALSWSPAGDLTNVYTITSPFPKLPQLSLLVNSTIDVSIFHQSSSSLHLLSRSRFATDQEPVKSRRERLEAAGRLAIRHSNSHRSNRNKNTERGGVLHLSTLKIMTLTGLDLCPESSRWTCRCPQHIQPRKDLEEDASFHRPAPVMSEDED